jgi:DNA repair exonuclease SbcCD ATPase subunit
MIPIRIGVQDFLTYTAAEDGGPVVLDFDGAALWSIAGDNGAGKSAIFDAVTYALYGEHRGGRQHDNRLIRKGATTAKVIFEFGHAGRRYKVERTVTRKTSRSGAPRPDAKGVHAAVWDDAEQAWLPVPDTDRPTELERWIRSLLGMGAETFCSSVLLRQGDADRLLTVQPDKRFKVLAGLLDLRAYQRLEQLALQRRRDAAGKAGLLEQQLTGLDAVTEQDVAEAATALQAAKAAVGTADGQRVQAEIRWHGAQRYQDLQDKHAGLSGRREEVRATVADAANIRRRAQEREQLERMIPPVQAAIEDLTAATDAATAAATAAETMAAIDLAALETAAEHAQDVFEELDEHLDALTEQADELGPIVAAASELHRCRKEHARRAEILAGLGDPAKLRAEIDKVDAALDSVRDQQRTLQERHKAAVDRRGGAQQRLNHAKRRIRDLDTLGGEAVCSRCGQPISPEHLQRERADADTELKAATADLAAQRTAVEELDGALTQADTRLEELASVRTNVVTTAEAAATAEGELHRAAEDLAAAQAECDTLAPPARVAGDLATVITGALDQAALAVGALTRAHTDAQTEIKQVKSQRDETRTDAGTATDTFQKGKRNHDELQKAAEQANAEARHRTQQAELRLEGVPVHVARAVRAGDAAILDQLTNRLEALADAEHALQQLEEAEADLAGVEANLASVDEDLAAIPPEHRIPLADAEAALEDAKQQLAGAQKQRDDARDRHHGLCETLKRRQKLARELADTRRRERAAQRLAVLLGKGELQGRLLTDTTAGVGAYANDTLARISGGMLEVALRREGADDDATLEILVTDQSSAQEPLEVAFISGSQKFRVAVALAAGLGQYLGGAAAIRALIVDEGFGSLDTDGRQRMIHELRTLAEHLDRIIVVSHHEDFSNRTLFPNGYLLRKSGARTLVDRVG